MMKCKMGVRRTEGENMGLLPKPDFSVRSVLELTPEWLASRGILALLLDVDNTLAGYSDPEPNAEVSAWLDGLRNAGIRAAVVSNGRKTRVERFCQTCLPFTARAGKPKPGALTAMARSLGVPPESVAMAGDQLRTDIAAGRRAGMKTVWVEPFHSNLWFRVRRAFEAGLAGVNH